MLHLDNGSDKKSFFVTFLLFDDVMLHIFRNFVAKDLKNRLMDQYIPQEEVRRIISDMVKKRSSIVPLVLLWFSYGAFNWICSIFINIIMITK